jgi:hypothetical protein
MYPSDLPPFFGKHPKPEGEPYMKYVIFHNNRNDEVGIADGLVEAVEPAIGGVGTRIRLFGGDEAFVKEDIETVKRVLEIEPDQAA